MTRMGVYIVVLLALGCSSGNVTVYPVKGKITLDGKPMVGGGTISLIPVGNQPGKTAGGEIAEDGTYQLMTYKPGDGSMTGEFRVVILQVVEKEPIPTKDGEKVSKAAQSLPKGDRIPTVYGDAQKSPLTIKVEPKSLNEVNFDLKRSAGVEPVQRGA